MGEKGCGTPVRLHCQKLRDAVAAPRAAFFAEQRDRAKSVGARSVTGHTEASAPAASPATSGRTTAGNIILEALTGLEQENRALAAQLAEARKEIAEARREISKLRLAGLPQQPRQSQQPQQLQIPQTQLAQQLAQQQFQANMAAMARMTSSGGGSAGGSGFMSHFDAFMPPSSFSNMPFGGNN